MRQPASTAPRVGGVVETCINVADMGRAREFYQSLFSFEVMEGDDPPRTNTEAVHMARIKRIIG